MQPTRAALPNAADGELAQAELLLDEPEGPGDDRRVKPNRNPPSEATRHTAARKSPEPRAGAPASVQLSLHSY